MKNNTKFDGIIKQYLSEGVNIQNIEFAIDAVKQSQKREFIIEGLMEDYRGVNYSTANSLVDDLYSVSGKEFKKENRSGLLVGIFLLFIGLFCSYYLFSFYTKGGVLVRPILVWLGAIVGDLVGAFSIIMAILGKHREDAAYSMLNED